MESKGFKFDSSSQIEERIEVHDTENPMGLSSLDKNMKFDFPIIQRYSSHMEEINKNMDKSPKVSR